MKKIIILAIMAISFKVNAQSSFHERDSVAHTQLFQSRVKMAVHIAAGSLLADPQQPTTIRKYAQLVITDPDGVNWLLAISCGVMTNPAVNWNSSDNDIQFTVNSIFGKFAYAHHREMPE